MDRNAKIGRDLRLLDRIVAGLLVLAGVAAWAAAAPRPARLAVLWILRRADTRAKNFAGAYPFWMGLPPRPFVIVPDGGGPAAAADLAFSLRMLALAIRAMAAQLRRRQLLFGRRAIAVNGPDRWLHSPRQGIGGSEAAATAIPDTS